METIPQISAELFTIPLEEDRFIVYAPLRQAAFVANSSMVNFLSDLQEGIFDAKIDIDGTLTELLRRLEILDAGKEHKPITTFSGIPEPTQITLFLTTACNLRCTYCYASAGDTVLKSMNLETAQRGIDFIIRNAVKNNTGRIELGFHGGGEPSANWKVMTGAFEYAKSKAAEYNLDIGAAAATNGVLRDDQIDWMIDNLDGVSLSFDGLPEMHDKHRVTITGKGSSHRVIHTVQKFDEAAFNYGIRITVTRDQIEQLPASVKYICEHFHPVRIHAEPSYQMGRWKDAPTAETESFITSFLEAQAIAHQYNHEVYYSAERVGLLTNHFCGITQDSFSLSPDGNVSACFEVFSEDNVFSDIFFYGAPDEEDGYMFNLPVLNNLRAQAVEYKPFCEGCYAKWHCAGDCYHKALTVNDEIEFQGSDRCHITRELTKYKLLKKIADSGGLFWHEPAYEALGHAKGKEILS